MTKKSKSKHHNTAYHHANKNTHNVLPFFVSYHFSNHNFINQENDVQMVTYSDYAGHLTSNNMDALPCFRVPNPQ